MEFQDYNSINHRLTGYFAFYFDIPFVLDKASHPSEKRLIKIASKLTYITKDFRHKVKSVYFNRYTNRNLSFEYLAQLSKNIEKIILSLGYNILVKSHCKDLLFFNIYS